MRRILILLVLGTYCSSFAEQGGEADIDLLIREGIALHDQGLYDEAIAMYEQALAINPDDAYAGYEMAYAYQASGDYPGCINAAGSALERAKKNDAHDEYVSHLYAVLASCHSASGDSARALEVFRAGLEAFPDNYSLHFNIAITLGNAGELTEADEHLVEAMRLQPRNPSPYYILARSLDYQDDSTALLALIAFLQLEFNTERSYGAAVQLINMLNSPTSEDAVRTLAVSGDGGDPTAADFMLQLAYLIAIVERNDDDTIAEPIGENVTDALSTYIRAVSKARSKADSLGYVADYLLPMSGRLVDADATEAFSWFVADSAGIPGAGEWLESNPEQVDRLIDVLSSESD